MAKSKYPSGDTVNGIRNMEVVLSKGYGKVFITLDELSEYLNEAVGTIRDWVARKLIPYYKRGRRLRFRLCEIEEWDRERNYHPAVNGNRFKNE